MTEKTKIVRALGDEGLLLPALLTDALAANDRLKLALTLLQEAGEHAANPQRAVQSLAAERHAAGVDDPRFDATIVGARMLAADRLHIPGAHLLVEGLAGDLATMLAPLHAAQSPSFVALDQRRSALTDGLPKAENDELAPTDIQAMTSARHDRPDSVHRLVMDAHREINALAAQSALEEIDGAHVHSLEPIDRARVHAFMAGLNRTAVLAFGHPGLGTTAARSGGRLTLQNDIGETDAHVLVIHVEDDAATLTYTDVHRRRARFFMSMFEGKDVTWTPLAEKQAHGLKGETFQLVTGRYDYAEEAQLLRFLEHLGSRIVFLIDWNKARKALQAFVGKQEAIDILGWSAAHDHGHRAFLELGGAGLVFEVVRRAGVGRIPYGTRLDSALGGAECTSFLRRVLRHTSEGLRSGRSLRLVRDEIQAELAQLFDTAEVAVLVLLVRHLGVTRTLASAIAEGLSSDADASGAERARMARRARQIEEKGDRLTVQAREACDRIQGGTPLRVAVDEVENATDALDEAAFLWTLAPPGSPHVSHGALADLADIVLDGLSEMVRAAEVAQRLPEGNQLDSAVALQAIDAVTLAERRADTAERSAIGALMGVPTGDPRSLTLGLELVRALEGATDHLAHAALSLREHVLGELSR